MLFRSSWLLQGGRLTDPIRARLGELGQESVTRWLESVPPPPANAHAELPFEWLVDGVPLVGVLDRVEESSPGCWRIIDYKVSVRRKSDADLAALYGAQLEIYAGALDRLVKPREVSAALVQITPEGVFETELPLERTGLSARVERLASRAREIASRVGQGASPGEIAATPGPACRSCAFRSRCDSSG